MPDPNKFQALRDAGYTIPVTCDLCVHSTFPSTGSMWGTCEKIKYQHEKHTGPARDASIIRSGTCPMAALRVQRGVFGAHQEFIQAQKEP